MKEKYLHIAKDRKVYSVEHYGGGGGHGGGGGRGHGGLHGMGRGRGWGGRGWGYGTVGYGYPTYYNVPVYDRSLCTQSENNPFSTGTEIGCCEDLQKCFGDWDNNGKSYYKCKYDC